VEKRSSKRLGEASSSRGGGIAVMGATELKAAVEMTAPAAMGVAAEEQHRWTVVLHSKFCC